MLQTLVNLKSYFENLSDSAFKKRLSVLDLEPIVFKLVKDPDSGVAWELAQADQGVGEYKKYLFLYYKYGKNSQMIVAPSQLVDKVWHQHQLDSMKYREDCEMLFANPVQKLCCKFLRLLFKPLGITIHAGFMEHFPYFGLRGEQDAQNLQQAFDLGKQLLAKHF